MAIEEDKTAKSAPVFHSQDVKSSRSGKSGEYFVLKQPEKSKLASKVSGKLSELKSAASPKKANPARILSMKMRKSVFEEDSTPSGPSLPQIDTEKLLSGLKRFGLILLAFLAAAGIGYGVYYFFLRQPETTPFAITDTVNRKLTSAIAKISEGDYAGAESILSQIDPQGEASCTKARYYAAYNSLYVFTQRGNSVPEQDVANYLTQILDICLKEEK